MNSQIHNQKPINSLILLAILFIYSSELRADSDASWDQYGGTGGQQYTELDQITADNLDRLEPAWQFRTGDLNQGFARKG